MRIAFIWDWPPVDFQAVGWQDGPAAALVELKRRGHTLEVFMPGEVNREIYSALHMLHVRRGIEMAMREFKPDVILMWGDQTRPNAKAVSKLAPMALCFAGGELFHDNTDLWQHIFVESEVYRSKYEERGYPVSIAFGCNTDLFQPMPNQPKLFDAIFPATFAHWKRHNIFASATEKYRSLAVGHIQPNDIDADSWQHTQARGTMILPHVTAEVLRYLYAASNVCVVTSGSDGGSQRTVLEAMAMNLPLIICSDSDKMDMVWGHAFECEPDPVEVRGMIGALLDGDPEVGTREYVLENWSERTYADALEEGLSKICAS